MRIAVRETHVYNADFGGAYLQDGSCFQKPFVVTASSLIACRRTGFENVGGASFHTRIARRRMHSYSAELGEVICKTATCSQTVLCDEISVACLSLFKCRKLDSASFDNRILRRAAWRGAWRDP